MNRTNIDRLDRQIRALKKEKKDAIIKLQKNCKHPHEEILEVDYEPAGYIVLATPPFRVCKLCGYAEEGWYCGYWELDTKEEVPTITREFAYKNYVLKFYSQKKINNLRKRK